MKEKIRIGSGAGYSGDRIEPAVELAEEGNIQYLIFECLAERTIALAQQEKNKNPDAGFDPLLAERMIACLPVCAKNKVKIITNMGAANPLAAMKKTEEIARAAGLNNLKIAAVVGDDVFETIKNQDLTILETGESLDSIRENIISANAYLGAAPVVEALKNGADVIITGRIADPALFMAPLIYEFDWDFSNYQLLGKGTVVGHLLECAGQITGGYFADPGNKDVNDLGRLGFPIAEVQANGDCFITKVEGSGGMVTTATCKEQLIYEIHDPKNYLTPDVIADFSQVTFEQVGKDKVSVKGGSGKQKTGSFKVSVGYRDSFIGEGQMSYGGPGAVNRARLALDIVRQRLEIIGVNPLESRFDIIGVNSLYGDKISFGNPFEARIRVAVRTSSLRDAVKIGNEVETLYTNGPAGGAGATKSAREVIAIKSVLINSEQITPTIYYKSI